MTTRKIYSFTDLCKEIAGFEQKMKGAEINVTTMFNMLDIIDDWAESNSLKLSSMFPASSSSGGHIFIFDRLT
jgi:hypothetical protein